MIDKNFQIHQVREEGWGLIAGFGLNVGGEAGPTSYVNGASQSDEFAVGHAWGTIGSGAGDIGLTGGAIGAGLGEMAGVALMQSYTFDAGQNEDQLSIVCSSTC